MRHGKKFNHLGRTASHRKAMLSNMAKSLLEHKRISTTAAKAKELRKYIEPLITKAKEDSTHNRRVVFGYLKNKESIKALFGEIVEKVGNRPGGYTRIIKTGFRLGDNADMCIIELVDYNELMLKEDKPAKKAGSRRSRRGSGKATGEAADTKKSAEASDEQPEEASKGKKKDKPNADSAKDPKAAKNDSSKVEESKATDADDAPKAAKAKAEKVEETKESKPAESKTDKTEEPKAAESKAEEAKDPKVAESKIDEAEEPKVEIKDNPKTKDSGEGDDKNEKAE